MHGSGDRFLRCSDGVTRWGRFGAAGIVFVTPAAPVRAVMMQLRSRMAHEGGTWSCPGGAINQGETPFQAGWRESSEEVGEPSGPWRRLGEHVASPASDWSYTTTVVEVDAPFGASLNFETDDVRWVPVDQVVDLLLHPGFAASWPEIRAIIAAAEHKGEPKASRRRADQTSKVAEPRR